MSGFTVGEAVTVSCSHWRGQVGLITAELAPLSTEDRNARWAELIEPFVERQRRAGVHGREIERVIDALGTLVASEIVRLERARQEEPAP